MGSTGTDSPARLWLDLASSLLGVLAGGVVLIASLYGPLTVGGADLAVAGLGLVGAGFSAVGVGHLTIEATHRGMGELLAGVGAIFLGLSYMVSPAIVPFGIGVLGLLVGGVILVAENFGFVGE